MPDRARGDDGEQLREVKPLHGGRHSLPPEVVAFNQRERLLAAIAATTVENGYAKTTIAQITAAASVSRRTFYEHFTGKAECFVAAFDILDAHLLEIAKEAAAAETEWPDRVAVVLLSQLRYFAAHPQFAQFYMIEAVSIGEATNSRREERARRLISLLELGRNERVRDAELVEGFEEALAGGVITLLFRRIRAGEAELLERFAPGLIEFVLSPYLGPEQATRIANAHSFSPLF